MVNLIVLIQSVQTNVQHRGHGHGCLSNSSWLAGPGQPIVHNVLHDLKLFFYVLVGICMLYNGPSIQKLELGLAKCFNKFFNTFEPSILKTITIQSDLIWMPLIVKHIHPYFKSIIPLLLCLCTEIILPLATNECREFYHKTQCNHDTFIRHIIIALSELWPNNWHSISPKERSSNSIHLAASKNTSMQSKPGLPKLLVAPSVMYVEGSSLWSWYHAEQLWSISTCRAVYETDWQV